MERLREAYDVTLEPVDDERLLPMTVRAMAAARERGLTRAASVFVYVSLSILLSPSFESDPAIAPLLVRSNEAHSLDDVYAALPARLPAGVWQSAGAALPED